MVTEHDLTQKILSVAPFAMRSSTEGTSDALALR